MINITEKQNCTGCSACANICPQHCITMETDAEGFWYPVIDCKNCLDCGLCEKACPILLKIESSQTPTAYAAYNKNETVRMESSSGGLFTLIAEQVIDNGGVVFGAAFDKYFNVMHVAIENKEDLFKLRGSKYVQSKIGDTYCQAKDYLQQGKKVLFTGTPCQIGGLKAYLGQKYDNLVCQDIICQGVPSPIIWKKYLDFIIKKEGKGAYPERITLRSKEKSWKQYAIQINFNNGYIYRKDKHSDLYMRAFMSFISIRPSCFACAFKSVHRGSEITLADFWGIQNVAPKIDDDKGTSLILVNNKKGQRVFDELRDKVTCIEVNFKEATKGNPMLIKSVPVHPSRENFFLKLGKYEFDTLINKYCSENIGVRAKRKVKSAVYTVLVRLGLIDYRQGHL